MNSLRFSETIGFLSVALSDTPNRAKRLRQWRQVCVFRLLQPLLGFRHKGQNNGQWGERSVTMISEEGFRENKFSNINAI
jgi:hypothetical protein